MKLVLSFWMSTLILTLILTVMSINYALGRIAKYMDIKKQRMLMKAFVSTQYSNCRLIWMLHSRKMEHRINSIHKRALKLVYQNFHDLIFQELVVKDKSVSVDQKNLQLLATELFKFTNPTKWPNTLKQFVGKLPTNCLSVFDHFVKLALKGLRLECHLN